MFNLGDLHRTGQGVPADAAEAWAWWRMAEVEGMLQAGGNRQLLEQAMPAAVQERAAQRYRDLRAEMDAARRQTSRQEGEDRP